MVPQAENPDAEPEPEELAGAFYVFFICSLGAEKQVKHKDIPWNRGFTVFLGSDKLVFSENSKVFN